MLERDAENKDVANWLKYYKKRKNISQQILADRIGIPYGYYIKQIENSELYPNRDVSQKLAKYFRLDTKYFLILIWNILIITQINYMLIEHTMI